MFLTHPYLSFWKKLAKTGVSSEMPYYQQRSIIISNQMSMLFVTLSFVLMVLVVPAIGIYYSFYFLWIIIFVFSGIPLLNYLNFTTLSRIILSLAIPLITLAFSIITKKTFETHVTDFYDVRILILVAAVVPPIIFTQDERKILFTLLLVEFLAIALFDPIHNAFGVGYLQLGFKNDHYVLITVVTVVGFIFQVASILTLKRNVRLRDMEKEEILNRINEQNRSLLESNIAIENQRKDLEDAKEVIEKQKEELSHKNQELEFLVNEKTMNLMETNNELIQYNNELRQFSYTISHNLRAPVASLIGLTNIIDKSDLHDDNKLIIDHIRSSSQKLDNVFKDLNKIIDLRNSIGGVKEKVVLEDEVAAVKNALENEIKNSKATIEMDLQVPIIYSIRPFLNSIMFNLISNAIKYKAKLRPPVIKITSQLDGQFVTIAVNDNGMGIDTHTYKEDIFKMYKRFHEHTEGKGLGLYLVKLQAESLGGTIDVSSMVNVGTTFTLRLKSMQDVADQTVIDTDFYRVFYDAYSNTTGISWKRAVTDEEYRNAFEKNLEIFRQFKTPHWISDMNGLEVASKENQEWLMKSVVPDALEYGLKKLAVVIAHDLTPEYDSYVEKVISKLAPLVSCKRFSTLKDAKDWINEE